LNLEEYLTSDQKELVALLNESGVAYVVVGAMAVAYHGYPRDSQDIDFFINPEKDNIRRLFSALDGFFEGGFDPNTTYDELKEGAVIGFGRGFQRTEFLSDIDGVEYDRVQQNKEYIQINDELIIPVIGYEELIQNKASTGQSKDQADVEELEKVNNETSTE
jgi:hypothetical protein